MTKEELALTHQVLTDLMISIRENSIYIRISTVLYPDNILSLDVWVQDEKTEKSKSFWSYEYKKVNEFIKAIESYTDSLIQSR
jgi:hypothetical protein